MEHHFQVIDSRYQWIEHLGTGRFATVYLVEDRHEALNKKIVKILRKDCASRDDFKQAFENEARILQEINTSEFTPNFVLLKRFKEDGGKEYPYIVLEYAGNNKKNLLQVIGEKDSDIEFDRGVLLEEEAINILVQCCKVLEEVHNKNIFYLDFKPEHIFWNNKDVMLIDWNISQRFVPGFNDRIDGIQLDLFLLGKIAYYLVTGSYPGDPPLTKWQREAFDKTLSINDMRERYGVPPVIVFGPYKHILRDQFKEIIKKALNKQYSEAIKMRADLEALPPIYRSTNKHTAAAHEAIRDGRYDDAFDALNQVIDHDPDDYEAFILLIWVRLARKQLSTKKNKGNTSST